MQNELKIQKGIFVKTLSLGSSFFWNISFQVELVKVMLNYSKLILLFKWHALSKAAIY